MRTAAEAPTTAAVSGVGVAAAMAEAEVTAAGAMAEAVVEMVAAEAGTDRVEVVMSAHLPGGSVGD